MARAAEDVKYRGRRRWNGGMGNSSLKLNPLNARSLLTVKMY